MATKLDYQYYFMKISKIVREHDPIGLLALGSPDDEYDGEIRRIIGVLPKIQDQKLLSEEIYKIFIDSFDKEIAGEKVKYDRIAESILK